MEYWQLKQRQSLPLEAKIVMSQLRIRQWYEAWDGDVYVSFSGGKDSTVLLHLVRSIYPDVLAVFSNTGLEFPEIKEFALNTENVKCVKPDMSFKQVIEKHGYPIISKEVSEAISGARMGWKSMVKKLTDKDRPHNCCKYSYLINAPFKISHMCCNELKKKPLKKFEKETGFKPFIGSTTDESSQRLVSYLTHGCNAFESKRPVSNPMSFWTEDNIWEYLRKFNVPYSNIYDMGYKRTGCVYCAFGVHLEKEPNKFQRLQKTHPQLYEYCLKDWEKGGLGLANVLDYINVPYKDEFINQITFDDLLNKSEVI